MDFFCLRDYVNVFETQRYYLQSLQVNKIGSIMRIASQNHEVGMIDGQWFCYFSEENCLQHAFRLPSHTLGIKSTDFFSLCHPREDLLSTNEMV